MNTDQTPTTNNQLSRTYRPVIVVTMGDPAGIGPEIVVRAVSDPAVRKAATCLVVGNQYSIKRAIRICGLPITYNVISSPAEAIVSGDVIPLISLDNIDKDALVMGRISGDCGQAAYEYISRAVSLVSAGKADAIATAPIHKESLRAGGIQQIGHTEILADLTGSADPLTMFEVRGMRVFFLSRHVSLREACTLVTKDNIVTCAIRCIRELQNFGIPKGPLAIAGLNPHSGEHGLFGTEEVEEIFPAVSALRTAGYDVVGPVSADSVFHQALQGKYAAVLSLYHDQGHIATKTLDFEKTISVTLGLPFLRTSVDHGTAFDIAGKGIAGDISMKEAILVAAKYANAQKARSLSPTHFSDGDHHEEK